MSELICKPIGEEAVDLYVARPVIGWSNEIIHKECYIGWIDKRTRVFVSAAVAQSLTPDELRAIADKIEEE